MFEMHKVVHKLVKPILESEIISDAGVFKKI